jgi:predicted phosphoribosyltransferase
VPFRDRLEAGERLAKALARFARARPIVLAIPRGGVPVGDVVARHLGAPLDLVLARKLRVPFQPELALGAVAEGEPPVVVWNKDIVAYAALGADALEREVNLERMEIARRRQLYLRGAVPLALKGRLVLLVDDGIATGATTLAAIGAVRRKRPVKLVLAVPVAPTEALPRMRLEVDELVCLEDYAFFGSIGAYYADFRPVTDDEVVALLERGRQPASIRA